MPWIHCYKQYLFLKSLLPLQAILNEQTEAQKDKP